MNMPRFKRSGSAAVIIIIVIVVLVGVGVVNYLKTERFPVAENVTSSDDKYPWEEHARVVAGNNINTNLDKNMVDISKGLSLSITVEDTKHSDQMALFVSPDGGVSGGWSTDHIKQDEKRKMNYNMNANFEGNIDPDCTYFDADGQDTTKLFLIARGDVAITAMNMKTDGMAVSSNDIFVSGWIDKDGKAKGKIGILLDGGSHKIYQWYSTDTMQKFQGILGG